MSMVKLWIAVAAILSGTKHETKYVHIFFEGEHYLIFLGILPTGGLGKGVIWKISPIYLDFADVPMQEMGVNGVMSNRFLLPRC